MNKFNFKKVFDQYEEVENLQFADILHLYDTGKECKEDNSGYHDARHFIAWAFNTETMQKCNIGKHDGIMNSGEFPFYMIRIYADGSFMIRLQKPVKLFGGQCIDLWDLTKT